MKVEIITDPLNLDIYGFSGTAVNKNYAGTAFKLMDRMWQIVKSNDLQNKGRNIWVYEPGEMVFAGVELNNTPNPGIGLEQKNISLSKYARYKYIGAWHLIGQAGQRMTAELVRKGYSTGLPYIEIYGHFTNDESKQETDLLMSLK